jgi:hypothetical protein
MEAAMADEPKPPVQEPARRDNDLKGKTKQAEKQSDTEPFDVPKDGRAEETPGPKKSDRNPAPVDLVGGKGAAGYLHNIFVG